MGFLSTGALRNAADIKNKVEELIRAADAAESMEAEQMAAFRGGYRESFDNEDAIKNAGRRARAVVADELAAVLDAARRRVDVLLESAFRLDAERAAELGPLLGANLGDADLRGLARKYRDSYTGLRLVAGREGSDFAKALAQGLDDYRASTEENIARYFSSAKTIVGTPGAARKLIRASWRDNKPLDALTTAIEDANDRLGALIDGATDVRPSQPVNAFSMLFG